MGGPQDRRAPRIPVELPVTIVGSKTDPELLTLDISRGGVFVKTDSPKPVRHLLRLRIDFSQGGEPIEVHGMVVHVTTYEAGMQTGEVPGMGIEFIAFGGAPRERWEAFLRQMSGAQSGIFGHSGPAPGPYRSSQPPVSPSQSGMIPQSRVSATPPPAYVKSPTPPPQHAPQPQLSPPPQRSPNPAQFSPAPASPAQPQAHPQKSPRKKLVRTVFPIPVAVVEQLYDIYEQELVVGEMFVCTPEILNVGARVAIRIIHPVNGNDYDLHGKVQEVYANPQYPGLSITLRPSTLARREKFRAFIEEGLPEEDVGYDLLDE